MTKDNRLLGEFWLRGITPAPRGVPQLEIQFAVDQNGILEVSARDQSSGASSKITIEEGATGRMSEEEIERMMREAEEYKEQDELAAAKAGAVHSLEMLIFNLKRQLEQGELTLSSGEAIEIGSMEHDTVNELLAEAEAWLEDTSHEVSTV
jgi:L1 cell adhesion molecule like protein